MISSDLFDQILNAHGGNKVSAGVEVARALMKGDEATFKAGYTLDNAMLAVADLYHLSANEKLEIRRRVIVVEYGTDPEELARHAPWCRWMPEGGSLLQGVCPECKQVIDVVTSPPDEEGE